MPPMPVSPGQLRNVRQTLADIQRLVQHEDDLKDFAEALTGSIDAFEERVDDRGKVREPDKGPQLGSRARSDDQDDQDRDKDSKQGSDDRPSFLDKKDDAR